jgi:group I intron endonuclease
MSQVIYKIINLVNDKFYVGSTTNKKVRFREHRKQLRGNRHHCKHLQYAWNKYGESKFNFVVIEEVPLANNLAEVEDLWLREHFGKPYCYNSGAAAVAPWRGVYGEKHFNFGTTMGDKQKLKISSALKEFYAENYFNHPRVGKTHSDETKAIISAKVQFALSKGRGGKFIPSAETRQRMSESLTGNQCATGYRRTDDEKEAIRQRMLGNKNWVGKKHTEASKAKMSKTVFVMPDGILFHSLTAVLQYYGLKMPTLSRALKSGKPLSKGRLMGHSFSYGGIGATQTQTDKDLIANKLLAP